MSTTADTTTATLELPPIGELEARLRAAREEAARCKRLLKVRRDLDAPAGFSAALVIEGTVPASIVVEVIV